MKAARGTLLFRGHRAWGSLFGLIFLFIILIALAVFLHYEFPQYLHFHIYYRITVEYILAFIIAIVFIILLYKHYSTTYIITTQEIVVKKGIVAANIQRYVYDRIQQIDTFQTFAQRILMFGQMSITLLVTLTGQSTPETAIMHYIHRPAYLSRSMITLLRIGNN